MAKKEILILTHEDGRLATKFIGTMENHEGVDIDVNEMKSLFEQDGYSCSVKRFSDLDMHKSYKGCFVVYASSEDYGKFYKDYIEDVILRLHHDGAVVLPDYMFLRAHANKAFQELLRASFKNMCLREPESFSFGSYEELKRAVSKINYPCVIKTSAGSGSSGVVLAHDRNELLRQAKRLMAIHYVDYSRDLVTRAKLYIWRMIKALIKHKRRQPVSETMYTNKIIVQGYIPGLEGDYKVLYFYGRYYILHRKNRENDFRASGSGNFAYPEVTEETLKVLDYARQTAAELDQPMVSMDIVADKSGKCYLIEFQCLYFGPLTMQYSPYYYQFEENTWLQKENTQTLEAEYCRAIGSYIKDRY